MPSITRHFQSVREIALPRAAVWHVLSQTDRLNRHIGLAPVEYGGINDDSDGFFRPASATIAGIALRWREYPFQWEQDGRYSVVRVYDKGPIDRFEGGLLLEDMGLQATKLTLFSDISPRGLVGRYLGPLIVRQFMDKTLDFCDRHLLPGSEARSVPAPPKKGAVDEVLLQRLVADLKTRPVKPHYAEALGQWLQGAGDDEVATLRPYDWAKEAGLEDHEALRTCLHGVKSGLLNMRWAMMCPNCRVSKNEAPNLGQLDSRVHCDLCGVGYDLNFDRYVELRFAVHPAVRRATADIFCVGGPFSAPHILSQKRVAPGEVVTIPILESKKALRLRVLKHNKSIEVSPEAPRHSRIVFDGTSWSAPSVQGPFTVENKSPKPIYIALEKLDWDDRAVTAASVTALQEFRDLFSSEVLKPGLQIAVENVTLFFSDLSNSTSLYERIGDASAFGRVGSHFDFLTERIARNRGAVVKTMGDAVMAVFHAPDDAVRAALEIQQEFRFMREKLSETGEIDIKIGLHHGPALAVNSNDRLDYFGRTVNIAARVAVASRGGDFVMTSALWNYPTVRNLLAVDETKLSRFQANLRGVEEVFELIRIRP